MPPFSVENIRMKGVAACVPKQIEHNMEYAHMAERELAFLLKTIGVERKRKISGNTTCSDLCLISAESLLKSLDWSPKEVNILIYVSQSRDYLLPCTAIILQDRLGLPTSTIAFDVPLGCSGYTYGISIITGLMSSFKIKKGLLLAGDASTYTVNPTDRKTFPLFGDAGSATAFELLDDAPSMYFNAGSDGSGFEHIIVPWGGTREPILDENYDKKTYTQGFQKGRSNLMMNGIKVFEFSITTIPSNIQELFSYCNTTKDDITYLLMHQANLLMNETIRKKLKFPIEKVPYSLKEFGNTSSTSIPLTMVSQIRKELMEQENNLLLSGFGVGLSWASALIKTNKLSIPELIEYE